MKMKQTIDIQALLEWAYRTQCVDRMTKGFTAKGPSASPANNLANYLTLGTRVDSPNYAARIIGAANVPDDAVLIHDAVLALDEVYIEWKNEFELTLWNAAAAESAGGHIVKRADDRRVLVFTDQNVEQVVPLDYVGVSTLLILTAKSGGQPDWHEDWQPSRGRKPKLGRTVDRRGRKLKSRAVDEYLVTRDRAIYGVWWWCMELLAAKLSDELEGFIVTGPSAPLEPWLTAPKRKTPLKSHKYSGRNLLSSLDKKIA